ncbi:cell wall hydrolase [Aureimonas sp. AU4]|uniref:cell wall hydrolase n=1 Tax=Aureimonas sp. AU4 TaxID=1638163 RepID=UPI000784CE56|nr:cell wall hydrolase [Aureimonas sp. AU4]
MPIISRNVDRRAARSLRRRRLRGAVAFAAFASAFLVASPVEQLVDRDGGSVIASLSALSDAPDFADDVVGDAARNAGPVYVADGGRSRMAERGGRVAPHRLAAVQPRFAAGSLGAVSGLLRAGMALGDSEMRTALAGPQPFGERMRIAAQFRDPSQSTLMAEIARTTGPVPILHDVAVAERVDASPASLAAMAAYAPSEGSGAASLFDNVLKPAPDGGAFVPPIGGKDHAWAAATLPPSVFGADEQKCLATAIYFEARGESEEGQAAVGQVILNRVRNPTYPKTICGVVYQNADWRNRCQFSFACDGIKDVIWNRRAYQVAERIADEVTRGKTWIPEVGSATHYHAAYVKPRWARAMEKVDKIGLHIFYRTFNGGWN